MTDNEETAKPNNNGMSTFTKLSIGVLGIGVSVVVGLFLRGKGYIEWPLDDDPPVTVSDSSLHARSPKNRWLADTNGGHTINPGPANGHLQPGGCGYGGSEDAAFSYTGVAAPVDISPASSNGAGWVATITYGANYQVTIQFDPLGHLTISDPNGMWDTDPADPGHKIHQGNPRVSRVQVTGGKTGVDYPVDINEHHFTIALCYL
jgi:hypothetical protein